MIHAFLLVYMLGDAVQRGQPMYFRNINDCNYFAARIVKRYGNYNYNSLVPEQHKATASCKPVWSKRETPGLY